LGRGKRGTGSAAALKSVTREKAEKKKGHSETQELKEEGEMVSLIATSARNSRSGLTALNEDLCTGDRQSGRKNRSVEGEGKKGYRARSFLITTRGFERERNRKVEYRMPTP